MTSQYTKLIVGGAIVTWRHGNTQFYTSDSDIWCVNQCEHQQRAGRLEVSEFEWSTYDRMCQYDISQILGTFDISGYRMLHVYHEYLIESITNHRGQQSDRLRVLICDNRQATLTHIISILNVRCTRRISSKPVQCFFLNFYGIWKSWFQLFRDL